MTSGTFCQCLLSEERRVNDNVLFPTVSYPFSSSRYYFHPSLLRVVGLFFLLLLRRHHQDDCRLDLFVVLLRLLYNNFSSFWLSSSSINEETERHVTYTDQGKSQTDRLDPQKSRRKRQASSVVRCPSYFNNRIRRFVQQ